MSVVMDETVEMGDSWFEFETTIRGHRVRCWLENGRPQGDQELLDRLDRFDHAAQPLQAVTLADLIHDAVGSDVTIRVHPPREPHVRRSITAGARP